MAYLAKMTPVPDSQPDISVPTDKELVLQTYKNVWEEYSSWDLEHCQKTLDSLSRPVSRSKPRKRDESTRHSRSKPDESQQVESCIIVDYSVASSDVLISKSYDMQTVTIELEDHRPYPPYTSCTPTSQNILVGDDSHYMPFMPFSDDPTYDFKNDFEIYHYVEWQRFVITPDEQVVVFETIKRLLFEGKVNKSQIDNIGILSMDAESAVALITKRDFPKWSVLSLTPTVKPETWGGPKKVTKYFLDYFCTNLSCVIGFCTMHDQASVEAQVPKPNRLPSRHYALEVTNDSPCGEDCFLKYVSATAADSWSAQEVELFSIAYGYAPDTLACDLAVICRKPCREVWNRQQRQERAVTRQIHKSKQVPQRNRFEMIHVGTVAHVAQLQTVNVSEIDPTAIHAVPAVTLVQEDGKDVGVSNPQNHVERKNVLVFVHTLNAIQKFAPAVNPDLSSNLCHNVGIQRGIFKAVEVRQSLWGLGLFISESCEAGDLVAEYVGEMIYEPTVISRNLHAKHRQRSYVFGVNPSISLDSSHVGNEARYINHSESPNCSTKVLRVNGSHRIGIYASRPLKEGEELFINYGPGFWESNTSNATQSTSNTSGTGTSDIRRPKQLDTHGRDEERS